jgi:hypothetical protein
MSYSDHIEKVLTPLERRLFRKLNSPQKIQDYLDTLPINFETDGETYMSPRRTIAAKTAHCLEGAVFAAAVLASHGQKPLVMDFQTKDIDEDHVVALFRQNGLWGAISKTNHAILRWRDPIYRSPRELAASYFNEYFIETGEKTLKAYSAPFDLSRFGPKKWVTAGEDLYWLVDRLDDSRHFPLVPKKNRRLVRKTSQVERDSLLHAEWEQ